MTSLQVSRNSYSNSYTNSNSMTTSPKSIQTNFKDIDLKKLVVTPGVNKDNNIKIIK